MIVGVAQLISTSCHLRPATRHGIWLAALLLVLAVPAITGLCRASGWRLVSVPLPLSSTRGVPSLASATARQAGWDDTVTIADPEELDSSSAGSTEPATAGPAKGGTAVVSELRTPNQSERAETPLGSRSSATSSSLTPMRCAQAVMLIWLVGAIFLAVRMAVGVFATRRLLRLATPFDEADDLPLLRQVKQVLEVSGLPGIVTSRRLYCPVVAGIWRPHVVLPAGLTNQVGRAQLASILIHECAHVVRRDHWVNLLQRCLGIVYWAFPPIHWMNRQLDLAREDVCDNFVLRKFSSTDYAETLVRVAELYPQRSRRAAAYRGALPMIPRHQQLELRIKSLLDQRRDRETTAQRPGLMAVCLVLLSSTSSVLLVHPVQQGFAHVDAVDEQSARRTYPIKLGQSLLRHGGSVSSVAIHPQGKIIASCGQNGIKLWDAQSGELIRELDHGRRGAGSVDFSPDGKLLASGGLDWTVRVWHVQTGLQLHMLPAHRYGLLGRVQPIQVQFASDGRLVSGGHEGVVQVWNPHVGKKLLELPGPNGARQNGQHGIYALAVSPDGKTAATSSYSGAIRLYDLTKEQPSRQLGSTRRRSKLTFTANEILASCSDGIILWDTSTGDERSRLPGDQEFTRRIASNSDGTRLVSAGDEIKLWDLDGGQELWTAKGHSDSVTSVAFSSDGSTLASGGADGSVRLWHVESGTQKIDVAGPKLDRVVGLGAAAKGKALVAYKNRLIQIWDSEGKVERGFEVEGADLHFRGSVAFSDDGRFAAAGHGAQVDLWNMSTGQRVWSRDRLREFDNIELNTPVTDGLRFSRDGRYLIGKTSDVRDSSRGQTILRVWEVAEGREVVQFAVPRRVPHLPDFNPDATLVALNTYATINPRFKRVLDDVRIEIYRTESGELEREYQSREKFGNSFGWSPDGSMLATGTSRSQVRMWDAASGELLYTLQGPLYGTNFLELRFSPDGKTFGRCFWHRSQCRLCVGSGDGPTNPPIAGRHAPSCLF